MCFRCWLDLQTPSDPNWEIVSFTGPTNPNPWQSRGFMPNITAHLQWASGALASTGHGSKRGTNTSGHNNMPGSWTFKYFHDSQKNCRKCNFIRYHQSTLCVFVLYSATFYYFVAQAKDRCFLSEANGGDLARPRFSQIIFRNYPDTLQTRWG